MTTTGDICLVSPATAAALDALLLLAVQKASEVIASGVLEPKDSIAAVKVIAEATKAASEAVSKGNGIAPAPRAHPASSDASPANGPPIYTLNDAVAAVCERDADTKALVPWARVICRIHRLCNMVEEQIAEHRGEPVPEPVRKTTNEMAEELAEKYDVPFSPSRMPAYEKKLRDYEREKKARQKAARAEKREASQAAKAAKTEKAWPPPKRDTCSIGNNPYSDYRDRYIEEAKANRPPDPYPDVDYSCVDNTDAVSNDNGCVPLDDEAKATQLNLIKALLAADPSAPT